ncbi:MAG: HEAT repeat protein [Planctomycetota bacterium]
MIPILVSLALSPLLAAHGGVYRGPGSSVPPGGSPGGGGGPSSGGGGGSAAAVDWRVWWSFNRDGYMRVKDAVHRAPSTTGDNDFYAGKGKKSAGFLTHVTDYELKTRVVPGMLEALKQTNNQDLITAILMALGKISLDPEDGEPVEPVLRSYLAHSNQEIAETAAISLGLFGRELSAMTLTALLADSEKGRQLVGRKKVPYRTRSFAAYGLGILAQSSPRVDVRNLAIRQLMTTLKEADTATPDLSTACLLSIGLCPLTVKGAWDPKMGAPRSVTSLEGQVAWLMNWLLKNDESLEVRAHAPMALTRLALLGGEGTRIAVARMFVSSIAGGKLEMNLERAMLVSLGELGDADDDELDIEIRKILRDAVGSADAPSRVLARVSWARVLSHPGTGNNTTIALEEGRNWLLQDLSRGRSTTRAWTALAIGILGFERGRNGLEVSPTLSRSLRMAARKYKSPRDIGAMCIAMGLAGDTDSSEDLEEQLTRNADDGLRGSAAIALGLLRSAKSREAITALISKAEHRPILLRELATALILLGDHSALPQLIHGLRQAKSLADQSAHAFAIGRIGDQRAVQPLLEILRDEDLSETTQAFAAAALGVIANDSPLPWNANLAANLQYSVAPSSLAGGGRGVLDLL